MITAFQLPVPLNPPKTSIQPPSQIPAATSDAGFLFRQKLLHLQTLNVNTQKALHQNPNFRATPLSSLLSLEHYFLSIGLSRPAVGRILDMHPKLLTADIPHDIEPIIDFLLDEVQIPFNDLPKSLTRCPRILVSDLKTQLRPTFNFLEEFGFKGSHRICCQTTLLLVSSVERTLKPKIDFLKNLGFLDEEVERMVIRSPGLLTYSVENNLVPKVEFFIEEMKGDLEELKKFPQYFSFSLENKIQPRYRVLVEHGFKLPLAKMLRVSDGEFVARLIEMRLELAEKSQLLTYAALLKLAVKNLCLVREFQLSSICVFNVECRNSNPHSYFQLIPHFVEMVYLSLCCALVASATGVYLNLLWNIGGLLTTFAMIGSVAWLLATPNYEELLFFHYICKKMVALLMTAARFIDTSISHLIDVDVQIDQRTSYVRRIGISPSNAQFRTLPALLQRLFRNQIQSPNM